MSCGLLAAICALVLCPSPDALAARQTLRGHVPAAVAGLHPVGALDGARRLPILIGLPLRNGATLTNLLRDLYDPASPIYHQYLTAAQFAEQFGPTEQDCQVVIAFAQSNGLSVTGLNPTRTLIEASGTVADIEKTFQIELRVYQHPVEARTFFAPDAEPSVDLAVPLLAITGLDSYIIPHPLCIKAPPRRDATPRAGAGPEGTFWGNDFRAAYVPGTPLTGAGQAVGLFESDGYYASDIASYESQSKLPSVVTLTNVPIDNFNGIPGANSAEVALDIEMVVCMAPGLSRVIVYEGPDLNNYTAPNLILDRMATDNLAEQLSCSWGFNIDGSTEQIFLQYQTQGQSFYLASGDTGAFINPNNPVEPPSDDPNITIVGGTTLTTSGGAWVSEKVWNWYTTGEGENGGASSGGSSTSNAIPPWQLPVSMASNQGSPAYRNLPDVALTADNVWVVYSNSMSGEFGGTSCAAPLWAGFTALANQQAAANGRKPLGFVNPAIYALGLGTNYGATFHDITAGNNTNMFTKTRYFAVPGYDLCTGWGTPTGTNLINALAPPATTPVITGSVALASESCLPTNGVIDPGETVTVNLTLFNSVPISTTNLVATLQAGGNVLAPSAPQYYGVLTGPKGAATLPFTFTSAGVCGQSAVAVWQLQDGPASLGTVTYNFTLGALVTLTDFAQNFDVVAAPTLPAGWAGTVSGEQVNWVTSTASYDTAPNSAFATDVANPGMAYLVSPPISITSSNAQLTFRQYYGLESASTRYSVNYYDGGVLEIQIGGGGFADILAAGGSFVTGGYVGAISTLYENPLAGREAWSGNSGGWIATTVNLPAAAAGQTIQLRWGCGTDLDNESPVIGWYVDTISITQDSYSCCYDTADLTVTQTNTPAQVFVGQPATYTITVTNAGPDLAAGVVVTDALPDDVTFVSASDGGIFTNGDVVCDIGTLLSGATSSVTVTILPAASGFITNTVGVTSITANSNPASDNAVAVTAVGAVAPPVLNPAAVTVTGAGLSIAISSVAGVNYTLEYKNALTDPAWTVLSSSTVTGTGSPIILRDAAGVSARFYRVMCN
jgi:uncharacterized repeat protein (TIGR01451 family)